MLPSVPAVTLNLLGTPSLVVGGRVRLLERKAAGVLAYVCLEGQVTRERVAGLLWPSVPNHSARNNLRQVLWRLRSYGDLVVGEPLLALAAHVHADVTASLLAASALPASGPAGLGEPDLEQPGWEGELLAGKDFSDCPAFEEWLLAERERFRALRRDALWQRCRADQAAGDLGGALRRAARLLELDPLSEPAYRLIMTLHVGRGDRAAALEAFYACRETLRRELGVSPTPETLALADGIRSASGVDTPGLPTAPTWQPPLVGREAEWTRLNAALDAGQNVIVSGPPGVGKTRLLREVLRARGPVLCLASRPNDEAVPYLALGRLARQLLKAYEDAKVLGLASTPEPLEDWVRVGAAHLLPDLWSEEPGTEPLRSPAAQRRFLEAVTRLVTSLLPLALATQAGSGFGGPGSLMFDDDQWMDEASWEAWMFVFSQPEWRSLGVQVGMTFRQGELPFARLKTVARLVEGRAALTIELQPLREAGVQALTSAFLERQEPGPVAASLVGALWRHTGGNPLFVLETLRSLIDVGRLPGHGEELRALPVPPQLEPLLYRRLEGVPASALRLARVAAVAGSEFDAELAAYVMDLHPLDLVQPWAELEAAQIMSGSRFAHDLIAQAALRSVPLPVRALLHARIAAHLQSRTDTHPKRAAPEHLALHWEAAGQPNSAAPHWVKAGWVALSRGAWSDAAWDFRRAVIAGDSARESVLEAQYGLGMALRGQDPAQAEQAFQAVLLSTPGIRRQVETHAALAELYRLCGRLEDALTQIVRATELARGHLTEPEQADLCRAQFAIHLRAGQYAAAEKTILTAQALAPWRAEITNEHALLLWMAGRFSEAAQLYERFQVPATRGGQPRSPRGTPGTWAGHTGRWAGSRKPKRSSRSHSIPQPPHSIWGCGRCIRRPYRSARAATARPWLNWTRRSHPSVPTLRTCWTCNIGAAYWPCMPGVMKRRPHCCPKR